MLATLDGLRREGFAPCVIAPPQGPLADELRRRDVEVLPFDSRDESGKPLSLDQRRQRLAELLENSGTELLHANSLSMGRLSGPGAAELNIPSIAHLRDIIKLSRQAIVDLNQHRRLLAVSGATRDFHVAAGLDGTKAHVLHNGVDLELFAPREPDGYLHRELGLPEDAVLIGTIGQICLRKGHDVLAAAARIVTARIPRAHFLIVGNRHSRKDESVRFEEDLKAVADELSTQVHLLGVRDDIDRLLGELTVLAHAARQEPLGRVLLESAAAGVAVVATDVGGTAEIFPPEKEAALIVPPDDAEAMTAGIERLIIDDDLRQRTAAAARRRAEEAFDIEMAVAGLVEHYRSLCSA